MHKTKIMDRRKSLKAIAIGTISTGILADACKPDKQETVQTESQLPADGLRMKEEILADAALQKLHFFTTEELATIAVLADIIIPKDEVSGSATDAKVPEFIDFIVNDMPDHQLPMRGGISWLNVQCLKRYNNSFVNCSAKQQIEIVDAIAYPDKAKSEMKQGVAFFNLMRNLTATGFYSTEIGWKDIGYIGNQPNNWDGVPDDVLKQYGLAYTEKDLDECVSFKKA